MLNLNLFNQINDGIDTVTERVTERVSERVQRAQSQVETTTQRITEVTNRVFDLNHQITQKAVDASFDLTDKAVSHTFDQAEKVYDFTVTSAQALIGVNLDEESPRDILKRARETTEQWSTQARGYTHTWVDQVNELTRSPLKSASNNTHTTEPHEPDEAARVEGDVSDEYTDQRAELHHGVYADVQADGLDVNQSVDHDMSEPNRDHSELESQLTSEHNTFTSASAQATDRGEVSASDDESAERNNDQSEAPKD